MYKSLYVLFFLNIFFPSNDDFFKEEAFNYSIQNIESQSSLYSFKLVAGPDFFEYNFSWNPTQKLLLTTKFINPSESDNKFYYNTNFSLSIFKNNIISIGINLLRFDNNYNSQKWTNYCITNEYEIHNWNLNTTLSYQFNQNFSFYNFSFYLHKNIYKNFDTGFGLNMSKFSNLETNIYFGIKYTL